MFIQENLGSRMGEGQFFYLFWSGLDFSLIPERTKVQPWEPSFFQGYIFHYIPKLGYEKHDYLTISGIT